MKKRLLVVLLSAVLACTAFGFTGCTKKTGEKIDPTRTQLYVSNYNGGYGGEWVEKVKTRFEEAQKDVSYEAGKTGVQVMIRPHQNSASIVRQNMANSTEDVFFCEQFYYYDFIAENAMLDITDIVEEKLTTYGESKSIEDKLTDEEKQYFKTKDGKYYAIPNYDSYVGIVFDIDLFEKEGFYFAADVDNGNDGFVYDGTDLSERSAGPDGKTGTYDDGLPVTYDDFFKLCDKMKEKAVTPIGWTGKYPSYVSRALRGIQASYEGKDQMMLNYTLEGTAKNLLSVNGGTVTKRDPVKIGMQNGYEVFSQAGLYQALKFMERLVKNDYCYSLSFNDSQTHTGAQEDFLYGRFSSKKETIGMLIEGNWWENEASGIFDSLVESYGEKAAKGTRRFGMMPSPKAEGAAAGTTLLETNLSACFINAKVPEYKKDLAKEFLKFCHTDVSLVEFSRTTNCPKGYVYDMGDIDGYTDMTAFGKWMMHMKADADVVYSYSDNELYLDTQLMFVLPQQIFLTDSAQTYPCTELRLPGVTAESYFKGIIDNHKAADWQQKYSKYWEK